MPVFQPCAFYITFLILWFLLAIDNFRVLCRHYFSLKYSISIGSYHLVFVFTFVVLSLIFSLQGSWNANCTDLDVYGSILSHISSAWYRYPNPSYLQDRVIWTLYSANMERTSIEDVWPHFPWIYQAPPLPPIMNMHWEYSWIVWFARSATSRYLLLGQFL